MTTWKFHISDHIILYAKYEISILNLVNIIKGFNNFVSQRGNLIFEHDKKKLSKIWNIKLGKSCGWPKKLAS